MKKKATVLVALISMCLIATAGIGAVSASDEPVGDYVITIFKINPDGTTTTIETFESSGPIVVKETMNEDGSRNIIREYRERTEDELHLDEACITTGTSETEVPMRIEEENFTKLQQRYSPVHISSNPQRISVMTAIILMTETETNP